MGEVKKIAELARIAITDAEAQDSATNLSGILEHFESIRSIDTADVPPADDISGLKNVMREDIAQDGVLADPAALLQKARNKNGYVEVSAVFTEQTVS